MYVILGVLMHCIVISNSWDISGAMGDVWNKYLIFTKAPLKPAVHSSDSRASSVSSEQGDSSVDRATSCELCAVGVLNRCLAHRWA